MQPRRFGRRERDEGGQRPDREREAGGASRDTDEKTLGERLADEVRARGAERQARGELEPPAGGVREEKIRDVRAADEEHARGGAEQQPELHPDGGGLRLEQRGETDAAILVGPGILDGELRGDDVELGLRLRE